MSPSPPTRPYDQLAESEERSGERRRRRLAIAGGLCAAGVLAAIAGAVIGAEPSDPDRPQGSASRAPAERPVDRLTLEQQVGQTLLVSFRGEEAPDYVLDLLRRRRAAGVVLFGENVVSPDQLRELTRELQRAARGRAVVAADQEGGSIRQLPWAEPVEGEASQTTEDGASSAAAEAARDLRAVGVNVNLAPLVDVGAPGGSAVGARTYPGDGAQVAALGGAAVEAYRRAGIAPTPKHFPGFGAAQANTDDEPVTIDSPRAQVLERDLEPFRTAIAKGTPLVMASHALYPALDRRRIASQSPVVLRDLLRRELGFRGAVMTDSIEAEAVLRRSSVATAAARSIAAGADLVLMTGPGSHAPVFERALAEAKRSRRFRARVEESAGRVLELTAAMASGSRRAPPAAR